MLSLSGDQFIEVQHPIDMVQELAKQNSWDFNRVTNDQIVLTVEALWRNYMMTIAFSNKERILKVACSFDVNVSERSLNKIYETLNIVNDFLWSGTFTFLPSKNIIMYKYGLLLNDDYRVADTQIDQILFDALYNCEGFYPSLQKVVWGGKAPAEAIGIAMMPVQGEA